MERLLSVNVGLPRDVHWQDKTESRTPDVDLARINCSPLPAPNWCPAPDLNWPPAFFKRVQSPDLLTGLKRQNNNGADVGNRNRFS